MSKNVKIVCMGDSLTEGYGIQPLTDWPTLLGQHCKVINAGISGDTTAGMLSRFHPMVIEEQPNYVIIMGGTNDCSFNLPVDTIVSNIMAMTKLARHHGIISIIGLPTKCFVDVDIDFNDLFISYRSFAKRLDKFRNKLNQMAELKDLTVIDFSIGLTKDHYLDDGVHPNEAGHRLMYENVFTNLREKNILSV
ncbi:MAG: hypothetical protein HKN68_11255 [Saprospiraceae bacterium]|nr:hypothetical protein [Saprospiraceae bacterium]